MRHFIISCLLSLLCVTSAWAWNLDVRKNAQGQPWLWVENNQSLHNVDIYLLHFRAEDQQFYSYHDGTWHDGVQPVFSNSLDLPPFAAFALTPWQAVCRSSETCVLGLIAVPQGASLDTANWQAAALLPLTQPAAQARWPGQTVFLPPADITQVVSLAGGIALDNASGLVNSPAESTTTSTEKPDVFRVEGSQILYANGQAQRLQAIDISDLSAPTLRGGLKLDGAPREVYRLHGYTLLLQSDVVQEGRSIGLQLSVLEQAADGQFSTVSSWQHTGYFMESRRRNDVLYVASSDYSNAGAAIHVQALRIGATGTISEVASATIPAYAYRSEIAIFTDYLVVTGNSDWRTTTVQVFDLRESGLKSLPVFSVPGRIPSEFHLDVQDTYLRLVYGPADRSTGSTLAVYDLLDGLKQVGSVGGIAPGEDLFATRFHGKYAYIVTYLRTDPLWVVDVSVPSKPVLQGHLEVPGWSEKLFFNDNRLFAVGMDDVPLDDGQRVRLVSSSLFDVSNPLKPAVLGRFTPLRDAGSYYSWSSALSDERALLLDWQDQYAMLPIETWDGATGVYLQKISLAGDTVSDGGRLPLAVNVQRSVELQPQQFGILGDQLFLTVDWSSTQPKQLGALELAHNLTWLRSLDGELWAADYGRNGYHRLYRFDPTNLETPLQRWSVAKAYQEVLSDAQHLVLFNRNPLSVQVLDRQSGNLAAPRLLAETTTNGYSGAAMLHAEHLYVPQFDYQPQTLLADSVDVIGVLPKASGAWQLQDWDLNSQAETKTYSIPGEPLGVTAAGLLVTRETANNGQMRLNLLALQGHYARLLDSRVLACSAYANLVWGDADNAYFSCSPNYYYIMQPTTSADNAVYKLNFATGKIADAGKWTFTSPQRIVAAHNHLVLMGDSYAYDYPYYSDVMAGASTVSSLALMPTTNTGTCAVYDLSGSQAVSLSKVSQCLSGERTSLTDHAVYNANGFAGLSKAATY